MQNTQNHDRRNLELTEALYFLERTPVALNAWLRGLPDGFQSANEGGGSWNPRDVIEHLTLMEHTNWMPRIRWVLENGNTQTFPPIARVDESHRNPEATIAQLLDDFATRRQSNVAELVALHLTDADFNRIALHPSFGIVTLRQLLATWVTHDFDHLTQITRVIARQYSDEVGPWRAYLRVISGNPG